MRITNCGIVLLLRNFLKWEDEIKVRGFKPATATENEKEDYKLVRNFIRIEFSKRGLA